MAELAGTRLTDASGNGLLDDSLSSIVDQNIKVTVDSQGYLYNANMQGVGLGGLLDDIGQLIDDVGSLFDLVTGVVNGTILLSQVTHLSDQVDDLDLAIGTQTGEINYFTADGTQNIQTVLDALSALSAGGLTTEEHDKLMALVSVDYDQIASAIWGYTYTMPDMLVVDEGPMMQTLLGNQHQYLQFLAGYVGLPVPDRAHFNYVGKDLWSITTALGYWTNEAATEALPELDLSLVHSGDTVWTYLTREYPAFDWALSGPGTWPSGNRIYLRQGVSDAWFVCTLSDADIRNWWPPSTDPIPVVSITAAVPPVWPGVDFVDLGSELALVDEMVITGALDGVVVRISGHPPGAGRYAFGDVNSWQHVGAVTFYDDAGHYERAETFGMDVQIITPRTMEQASGCVVRLNSGWTGTIQPWVRQA